MNRNVERRLAILAYVDTNRHLSHISSCVYIECGYNNN